MNRRQSFLALSMALVAVITLQAPAVAADQPRRDVGKRRIEAPVERLVGNEPRSDSRPTVRRVNETRVDPTKIDIEAPTKAVVKAPRPRLDVGKGRIEMPVKKVIGDRAERPSAATAPQPAADATSDLFTTDPGEIYKRWLPPLAPPKRTGREVPAANPTVEPGKVTWHENFEAACRASARSGKPVLLFQLMGQLDQRFT